eukprot:TRINITY_DN952_c0_g1_i3.p1 TRINITY_DN952_c0_g1~~TRINITY_DN952_c0_g1_i3.p1  ORF type:complete len:677 (+),score=96.20 TRINITY_DN952_c0_g1_i3:71-2032(+)
MASVSQSVDAETEPLAKRRAVSDEHICVPAIDAEDEEWNAFSRLWASWDMNATTRSAVLQLVEAGKTDHLREILGSRLEFGTAGLRGRMGPGSARMNDLVVVQSTQGVCSYVERCFGDAGKQRGVVIGFDHRSRHGCNSRSFAILAAAVFIHKGFRVYLFDDIVATPMVPWCLDKKGCCAGVMITASHNPADDNGYKLYWDNGAQIVPPHDMHIAKLIEGQLVPWSTYGDEDAIRRDPNCVCVGDDVIKSYFQRISSMSQFKDENRAMASSFLVTYTAMHGVGHRFVERAFEAFEHDVSSLVRVASQIEPDPDFPTVAFPNPEEGKGALKLAIDSAEAAKSALILANDPDADRLAVAEQQQDSSWHVFTGNEIGALLGHWSWLSWRRQHPQTDVSKVCMVASTVSSKFLASVARLEGFRFVETLTGFKWMGSKSAELRKDGFEVIFSFEEAIGFCVGDVVKDKDGIFAAVVFLEMAKQLRKEGKTCKEHLGSLYEKYGHVVGLNSYLKSPDPSITKRVFAQHRTLLVQGGNAWSYAKSVGNYAVTGVRDLTVGFDTRTATGQPDLPLNIGGEMITFYFGDIDAEITLRSSGTEPKIKFYAETRCLSSMLETTRVQLASFVQTIVLWFLDPHQNGLEIRPEDAELFGTKTESDA